MPLYGVGDLANAHREGRIFQSFFTRTGVTLGAASSQWIDTGMANGSTGYDVKTGTPLTFTPRVSTNNTGGIWPGPAMPSGMTRHIVEASLGHVAGGSANVYESLYFYDLLGYYPQIDGTIADTQIMDNTQTLPRYADGIGVMGVWISHLVPANGVGTGTMTFVDHADVQRTATVRFPSITANGTVLTGAGAGTSTATCICQPLGSGSRGIKRLVDVTYGTAQPGGFQCFLLIKPLFTWQVGGSAASTAVFPNELCFTCHRSSLYPEVKDGASINFFAMHNGGSNTLDRNHGSLTFAWG